MDKRERSSIRSQSAQQQRQQSSNQDINIEENIIQNQNDKANLSMYSQLAIDERSNSLFPSRQQLPWYWRYAHKIDIFSFEPVPITSEISTRRSQFASIACITIMLAFVGFTMYQFFFNNTPRLNTYSTPINYNQKFQVQEFAFGFYEMDTSSNLIEDPSIFTYYLEQYVYSNLPSDKGHEELSKQVDFIYCTPSWAPIKITMLCPKEQMYMQGMIGKGDYLMYPRLKLLACSEVNTPGVKCDQQKAISEFPKGRLFIFVKQDKQINFAADQTLDETGSFYYFFIVPKYYIRAETIIGSSVITKQPNYGTSFTEKNYNYKAVINSNLYISDVSYYFESNSANKQSENQKQNKHQKLEMQNNQSQIQYILSQANKQKINVQFETFQQNNLQNDKVDPVNTRPYFAWWMSISSAEIHTQVNYQTSAQMISLWGGLWGVIFAAFTFIYMTYNAKQFYSTHKAWDKFDNVISVNDINKPSILPEDAENFSSNIIQSQPIQESNQLDNDEQINNDNKSSIN
ncbi:transmembrane protein, putative (macronuclear) [Tetrahymena thermophila SB210]|uniref:Transmembrane protein, putative n=1 Tax=Tetrahymena thermophila (strain SB210) TaxID=312017 RepID=I7LUQ0_TETTS|nr:transmembrane protein, putative [Tetrahymena thermophila SB210]EAR95667.1 transmembrane protein, putative [Tetrahymena thermophila SB210]|eukprot:XP_001015912.1 transmembrane protein, putative [Tetrahymena thermophila SB210]